MLSRVLQSRDLQRFDATFAEERQRYFDIGVFDPLVFLCRQHNSMKRLSDLVERNPVVALKFAVGPTQCWVVLRNAILFHVVPPNSLAYHPVPTNGQTSMYPEGHLTGIMQNPQTLAFGVRRGLPHFAQGGPYIDNTW